MPSARDVEELAAVVADGRPFDWADAGPLDHRPLHGLWRAVRERQEPTHSVPRASLSTTLVSLTVLAIGKAVVAAGLITMAPQAVNVTQVVTLASFTVVGVALVYGGHRDLRAARLGVVLVLFGSVMLYPLLRQVSEVTTGAEWLFTLLQAAVIESALPSALWLFVETFPQALWSPRDASVMRRGVGLSTLTGLMLFLGNAMIVAGVDSPTLSILNRDTSGAGRFWWFQLATLAPALGFMLWRRRDAHADERAKANAFAIALVVALMPTVVVLGFASPRSPLRPWFVSHFALTQAVLYSGLIALPLVTGYAVLAHGVVRVDLVVRNAARYALARGLLLTVTVGPLALLVLYAFEHRDQPVGALFETGVARTLLVMGVAGAGLLAARARIQRFVDRALRRDSVSLASALDVFSRRSGEGLGLGDVADAAQRAVVAAFHPAVVAVLVADRARDAFVPVGAPLAPLPRSTWLAQSLADVREPVVVDLEDVNGVARLLPPTDQAWLADGGIVVLAPLLAGGGTVCGLVALGAMASGRRYARDDLRYLGALSAAAAPAIESRLLRQPRASSQFLDDVRWDDESGRECESCGSVFAADVNECRDCQRPTEPMGIPVHLHGKFTVLRRLGAGGMGVAYLAQDDALGRSVALKTLPRVRPEAVEQLRREARAMAQVSHSALATIHGLESWRAVPVLVVEYLPGGTLADRLRQGPLPEAEVVAMARHVLGGLRRLHEAGLLHRDLKPSNIGFGADGAPKVLDFGLSRLRSGLAADAESATSAQPMASDTAPLHGLSTIAGTPAYMSPELVADHTPSAADDLWALAVLMVESLHGRHPWAHLPVTDVLHRLRSGDAPGRRDGVPEGSVRLRAFLASALSRTTADRPQSASAFDAALGALG